MKLKKLSLFTLLLMILLVMVACNASGSEPAVEDSETMEEMDHDDEMEDMDHDEDMEHEHDDESADHDHEHEDSERIMNDGATIEITSPATGDTFAFGEQVLVEVEVVNFELGVEGSHWHVYIDGSSWGMVMGGNLDQPLVGLEPGQHMVEVYLAGGDHIELMDGDSIMIVVEEQ